MFRLSRLLRFCALIFLPLSGRALAQVPVLVAQAPLTGNSGNTFFVFLPVTNVGPDNASNIQLTSVALTFLGSPAATVLQPATLPFMPGSGYLAPNGVRKLDLEFDNSSLVSGSSYMVELDGTYQVNGTASPFSMNVPVTYSSGFAATHAQVRDTIQTKFQNVPGLDPQVDDQTMLAFVQGLPQVQSAHLGTRSPLVWVTFNDGGEPLEILNNVKLPAQPHAASTLTPPTSSAVSANTSLSSDNLAQTNVADASGAPTEIPTSIKARLLYAMGGGFANPIPDLHAWLVDQAFYSDPINAGTTVDALRNVGGDGVFYIASHFGADPSISPNIWTSTPVPTTGNPDPQLQSDIDNGYVVDVAAYDLYDASTQEWTKVLHYGITASFIAHYWGNFSNNSLVYIDACESDSDAAGDIRQAIFNKNAAVYVGWTDDVGNISADTARLVFDRLLGANRFCPENGQPCALGQAQPPTFAQRPFDYTQVATDLPLHSLGQDTNPTSQLKFEPNGMGFGLLAPSIVSVYTVETDVVPPLFTAGTLVIGGIFGSDPQQVTVGGQDCPVKTGGWNPNQILCNLPSGAAGDVVVTVRLHDSNKAQLTKWNGTFSYSILGDDSLKVSINYHAVFRVDVRKFRGVIHNLPIGPFFGTNGLIVEESSASYACSGSAVQTGGNTTTTITWTGGGSLPASHVLPAAPGSFQMIFDGLSSPTITVGIDHGPGQGCDWQVVTVSPSGTFTTTGHWDLSRPGTFGIGALPIEPNDPSFAAGSQTLDCSVTLPWFTPPQCKMQWDTITATFPPDATSAR